MDEFFKCPTCGHKRIKHKHVFSKVLADILLICARAHGLGQPFHLQHDLRLTPFQYNNFQKLKYWELVQKHFEGEERRQGMWLLTARVFDVLHGEDLPKHVYTVENVIVERSSERITMIEAAGGYDVPRTWAQRSGPAVFPNAEQLNLLKAS